MVTNGLRRNTDNLDQGPVLSYNTNPTLMPFRFRGRNHRSSIEALRILFLARSIIEVLRHSDYSRSPSSKGLRGLMSTGTTHWASLAERIPQRGLSAQCPTRSYPPARHPLALARSTPWSLAGTRRGQAHSIPGPRSSHRQCTGVVSRHSDQTTLEVGLVLAHQWYSFLPLQGAATGLAWGCPAQA